METGVKSNIGKRIFKIKDKIKSENFLLLNGDAIFNFNLKKYSKIMKIKKESLHLLLEKLLILMELLDFVKIKS